MVLLFNFKIPLKNIQDIISKNFKILAPSLLDNYFSGRSSPICRTVSDAVAVLDAIVGFDSRDAEATRTASSYIPQGGYAQFLKLDGIKGKRLGVVRNPFFTFDDKVVAEAFEQHLRTLR